MIIHKRTSFISKKTLIISGAVLVVLAAVVVGGWSLLAMQAEQKFAADLGTVKNSINEHINSGATQLKGFVDANDATQTAAYLNTFAVTLKADDDAMPVTPQFFGLNMVGDIKIQHRDDISNKIAALRSVLLDSAELLVYEQKIVKPLTSVDNLEGKTAEDQTKLAAMWEQLVKDVDAVTPPSVAKDAHAKLLQAVKDTHATLATLPALFTKKDTAGFAAKSKQLDANIATLQALQADFNAIDQANDQELGKVYAQLTAVVQ